MVCDSDGAGTGGGPRVGKRIVGRPPSTVLYAAHAHNGSDGVAALDVLVLLRGEPGWYARTPRGASILTGATSSTTDGRTVASYWTNGGGFTVTFDTDSEAPTVHVTIKSSTATLLDRQVAPQRENVMLVDGVGAEPQPAVRTLLIDPRISGDGSLAARAIRHAPALTDFVQCNVPLPETVPDEQGPLGRSLRNQIARACEEMASNGQK